MRLQRTDLLARFAYANPAVYPKVILQSERKIRDNVLPLLREYYSRWNKDTYVIFRGHVRRPKRRIRAYSVTGAREGATLSVLLSAVLSSSLS